MGIVRLGDKSRRCRSIGISHRDDSPLAQIMAALAERLRMAHRRPDFGIGRLRHQAMCDGHEIFVDDVEARFGKQEVDVGHPAVERIFNRNDRAACATLFDGVDRILEGKAGNRKTLGSIIDRREVGIGTGRTLKGNRLFRHLRAFFGHFPDHSQCVFRKAVHHAPLLLRCDSRTGHGGARN